MMRQLSLTNFGLDQTWPSLLQSTCYRSGLPLLYVYPYAVSVAGRPLMTPHDARALRHTFGQHTGVDDVTSFGAALRVCIPGRVYAQSLALLLLLPYAKSPSDYATTYPTAGSSFIEGAEGTYYDIWGEKMNQGMSDDELELRQLLAINLQDGFVQFVEKYQGLAYKIAQAKLNDQQTAYDAVQDAFFNAYNFLKHQSGDQIIEMKLKPWFYVVTVHACYRYYRTRTDTPPRSAFLPLEDILDVVYSHTSDQPEMAVELHELIIEAFLSLPSRYRIPCTFHYLDCLKAEEIAKLLNQPTGTIKAQISRGTKLLRKKLEMQMKDED